VTAPAQAPAAGIRPNDAQRIRDGCHLRRFCAACGHPETRRDPLVLAADGYRVHLYSHILTRGDGYYGVPFAKEAA
jgi:hypothetical protein